MAHELAREIEQVRLEAGFSIEDLLEGLLKQRQRYVQEKRMKTKFSPKPLIDHAFGLGQFFLHFLNQGISARSAGPWDTAPMRTFWSVRAGYYRRGIFVPINSQGTILKYFWDSPQAQNLLWRKRQNYA
jgi:hypothetical protein